MTEPAFRDITDFSLDDPDTVIAKVIEEVDAETGLQQGSILSQDRQLAVRFIESLEKLTSAQWAVVVDKAWAEVGKRPDVLAAMVAGIPWESASADLVESLELPAAARTRVSRRRQAQLVTELAQRHLAAEVAMEVAILALLWRQYPPGWYESFADVVPFAGLSGKPESG